MDQGVIANFNKYYIHPSYRQALKAVKDDPNMILSDFWKSFNIYMCIKHTDAAWREVSHTSMNGVWKALSPQFVNSVQGKDQEEGKKILKNLVEIFKKLDINFGGKGLSKAVQVPFAGTANEELVELETMQGQEEDEEELLPVKKFQTKLMANRFSFMEKALTIFENQDPNFERFSKVATSVRDSFQCYRIIYDEKKKRQCKHP